MESKKTITTISISENVKLKAQEILARRGITFSFYIEQILRSLIKKQNLKGGNRNGIVQQEEER